MSYLMSNSLKKDIYSCENVLDFNMSLIPKKIVLTGGK
jgi:hypothetical protein